MRIYRWMVAIEGTFQYTNFAGYKTKKEATYVAEEMTRLTGKRHRVIDTKSR